MNILLITLDTQVGSEAIRFWDSHLADRLFVKTS